MATPEQAGVSELACLVNSYQEIPGPRGGALLGLRAVQARRPRGDQEARSRQTLVGRIIQSLSVDVDLKLEVPSTELTKRQEIISG